MKSLVGDGAVKQRESWHIDAGGSALGYLIPVTFQFSSLKLVWGKAQQSPLPITSL